MKSWECKPIMKLIFFEISVGDNDERGQQRGT
jgi:hypothetical protein